MRFPSEGLVAVDRGSPTSPLVIVEEGSPVGEQIVLREEVVVMGARPAVQYDDRRSPAGAAAEDPDAVDVKVLFHGGNA